MKYEFEKTSLKLVPESSEDRALLSFLDNMRACNHGCAIRLGELGSQILHMAISFEDHKPESKTERKEYLR